MIPANAESYLHDADRKALAELKKIPGFDKICSKFISTFNEPYMKIIDMSSKIRISEKQLPRVYHMLLDICEKLGITQEPGLYLELNRNPNAYTYGDKEPSITITSGLLECMQDDEIYAVLAHECGHIACQHVLYHTIGNALLTGGLFGAEIFDNSGLLASTISIPLKIAFYYWMRCSEFSADRAATICCGKADPVVETMMRLAGGTTHIDAEINKELFINQASEYNDLVDDGNWNKMLEFYFLSNQSHPLLSVRAHEAIQWQNSQRFRDILDMMNGQLPDSFLSKPVSAEDLRYCKKCGAVIKETDAFCPSCGVNQDGKSLVERLLNL